MGFMVGGIEPVDQRNLSRRSGLRCELSKWLELVIVGGEALDEATT